MRLDAQQLLTKLPANSANEPLPDFDSFQQAKAEGDSLLAHIRMSQQALTVLRQATTESSDDPAEADPSANTEAQLSQLLDGAISAYRQALQLADADTSPADRASTQLLLAYVCFEKGEYYDAAALSAFLARHASDESAARSSARMALAAFSRLFEESTGDPDFATRHWIRIAEYAAKRWPDDEEGQTAAVTLVRFLITQGRVTDARAYLDRLSADSPLRAEAELMTGMGLYQQYRQAIRPSSTSRQPRETTDAWRQQAEALIDAGLDRSRTSPPTSTVVRALLVRARLYLDANRPADALEALTSLPRSPYALVQKRDPLVTEPDLLQDVYRTMLSARLAGLAVGIGQPDEVTQLMEGLRAAVGDSEAGRQRLVSIYVALARDLRQQIQVAPANQQLAMAASFARLLDQVAESATDSEVLLWTAHTLQQIAELFPSDDATTSSLRAQLLSSAEEALQSVLEQVDPSADAKQYQQTVMRLAAVKRRRADFRGAIPLFAQVLENSPNLVNIQMEAAATYQEGGAYRYAIKGGRPDSRTRKTSSGAGSD